MSRSRVMGLKAVSKPKEVNYGLDFYLIDASG